MTGEGQPEAPVVAHYMQSYLGLTETFIHEYLTSFTRVRPIVIARRLENLDLFPLDDRIRIHQSPPRRGTPSWGIAAVRRRVLGGQPHLESLLASSRARLLHAHFGPAACDLIETRRRTGLPLVTSFYGYDATMRPVIEEFAARYRRLFDVGDAFLVEGSAMKKRVEALGCPSSKLRVQRIGIDPGRIDFRPRESPASGRITLLQCGRMVPKKGYEISLRALALARRDDDRIGLRILGDGPGRRGIETLIEELGLAGAVDLAGAVPRSRYLEELGRADIYLQPSLTAPDGDSEGGAPTTLLEAQAAGLPVLTSRHADIPEIVREHDSALLSDEGDAEGLAGNMLRLASRPETWASMGRAGRAHVEQHHDIHRLATDLEIAYATIAETGRIDQMAGG